MAQQRTEENGCLPQHTQMGRLICRFDWSKTALGSIETWPSTFKATLAFLLDSPLPALIFYGEECTLLYNDAYASFIGSRHPQLLGKTHDQAWPDYVESAAPIRRSVLEGNSLSLPERELSYEHNGRISSQWLAFECSPILNDEGLPCAGVAFIKNRTAQVLAEQQQRLSDRRLRALTAVGTVLLWRFDPAMKEVHPLDESGALLEQLISVEQWLAQTIFSADQKWVAGVLTQGCQQSDLFEWECRLGAEAFGGNWVQLRAIPLFGDNGKLEEWFVAAIDIRDRKQREEAQRKNQRRLAFFDRLNQSLSELDQVEDTLRCAVNLLGKFLIPRSCHFVLLNPTNSQQKQSHSWHLHSPSEQLSEALNLADLGPELLSQLHAGQVIQIVDLSQNTTCNLFGLLNGRSLLAVPWQVEGALVAVVLLQDVSMREWQTGEVALLKEFLERFWPYLDRLETNELIRKNEQRFVLELERKVQERTAALASSEATLRVMSEASYQYQGLFDLEGRCLFINNTALKAINSELEPLLGQLFWETAWYTQTPGAPERIRQACSLVVQGESLTLSMPLQMPIGLKVMEITFQPVLDEQGEVISFVAEGVDRTAVIDLEQTRHQAQKMEALGRLTGGIAHDFNNLLTAVLGSLELLRRRLPNEPAWLRLVDNAQAGAERGAALTARMLAFSRKQELRPEPLELRTLVHNMKGLLESSLGPEVILQIQLEDQPCMVRVDGQLFETALLNLAINASDALEGKGVISLSVSTQVLNVPAHGLEAGRYICLRVLDQGVGMDEQTLKRASEPFFTTKGLGKGTGLGLSMVHGLALQSGGILQLQSELGVGTSAQIWLPEYQGDLSCTLLDQIAAREQQGGQKSLRILVVDDDNLVLVNTVDMLDEAGHCVLSVSSGADALKILKQMPFDLMITDHAMPHMSGLQLTEQVRLLFPHLAILLVTGYAEISDEQRVSVASLAKPFSRLDLLKAIDELLPEF